MPSKEEFTLFDKLQMTRIKPLLVFFVGYTFCFFLLALTISYTFPFVAGFFLALLLQPLVRFLKKKLHLRPGLASILVTLLAFFILFGLLALLGYWLVTEITTLVMKLSAIDPAKIIDPLNETIGHLGIYIDKIDSDFIQRNQEQLIKFLQTGAGILTSVLNTVLRILTSLPAILTMLIVMIFSTYFFSKDLPKIKQNMASFFSQNTVINLRSASRHSLAMSGKLLASFLLIYFITFLETLVVFFFLGVPYPLVLSLIAGVSDILPILGPGTVYVPLALFYVFQGDYFTAVALLVGWLLISTIRQVIQPKIVSASIDVHPLCMLAALYFALVSGKISILIYMTVLFVLYQVLCKSGVLPRLFETAIDPDRPGKRPIPPVESVQKSADSQTEHPS